MMRRTTEPKRQPLVYAWYVFVMRAGSVERSIGTRLETNGDFLEVYDQRILTLSVEKSQVLDHWQQDRRATRSGEQRIKEALPRVASAAS
jgi:hypothetical protein